MTGKKGIPSTRSRRMSPIDREDYTQAKRMERFGRRKLLSQRKAGI